VRSRGPSRRYLLLKRTFDVVLCLGLLVVCLPVLALCALAVGLNSPGPIVFSQLRTGRDGRRFRMYKFRTMVANAEELKASLAHLNVLPAPDFKIPDDPRITRVGKLLRATSLDELPQLFNVLRGDMSLVGPRPTSFAPSTYDTWHTHRLDVPPGLTGLWQVEGRHTMTFDDRLRLDVQYIRRASITYDLVLLARTVRVVARRSGA
jgi:lipopolysaccharide/colanic/teichoic acid biosynthesis glycosyltransferase